MAPTACVTGATGYVASELIRQLLARGYAVKATVRCAVDSPRLQYLRDLAGNSEGTLQLVQVPDIEHASEALDTALQGVSYVFHVASPFRFDGELLQLQCSDTASASHRQACSTMHHMWCTLLLDAQHEASPSPCPWCSWILCCASHAARWLVSSGAAHDTPSP